jgi:hypothetical protein
MYKGMAIAGKLTDATPNESGAVDLTMSYINVLESRNHFNFNGGSTTGTRCIPDAMYPRFDYIAKHVVNSATVKVFTMVQWEDLSWTTLLTFVEVVIEGRFARSDRPGPCCTSSSEAIPLRSIYLLFLHAGFFSLYSSEMALNFSSSNDMAAKIIRCPTKI